MKTSELDLLERYAKEGDQAAFAELVEKHLTVAYSAAYANLQSSDLAHDACQLTFLELAKKARRLPKDVQLAGWIYSTSRNISRKLKRSEVRRAVREKTYLDEMDTSRINELDQPELNPLIHEALEKLKPVERNTIILRFFEGKNFSEIGQKLGMSEDAARMRLNRAMGHLNNRLARKGIHSTAAALAVAIPTHAVVQPSAGLAASISATATGTAGIQSITLIELIITIMKTKTAITVTSAVIISAAATTSALIISNGASNEPFVKDLQSETSAPADLPLQKIVISDEPQAVPEPAVLEPERIVDELAPDPQFLQKAETLTALLATTLTMIDSLPPQKVRFKNPSQKLALRFGLDEATTAKLNSILVAYGTEEHERVKALKEASLDLIENQLEANRDDFVTALSLEFMEEDGLPLNETQEAFLENYEKVFSAAGILEEPTRPTPWNDSTETVQAINDLLTPEQQGEFDLYLEEEEKRKTENKVFRRTDALSTRLGLSDEDRSALHTYLTDNPDASNEEISEILSPELRELLPKESQELGGGFLDLQINTR